MTRSDSTTHYPRITVVMPSFNQAAYIEEAINSVLDQRYPNLEFMILDGGSTDGSQQIIERYANRLAYWVSEPDNGQTHAINKGFQRATGEILTWLNSDDLLLPGAVSIVVDFFEHHPETGFVYGDCQIIDGNRSLYYVSKVTDFDWHVLLYGRTLCGQPASFFRREILDQIGFLDESYDFCMDLEFWIRAAKEGVIFKAIYQPLAASRLHGGAKTIEVRYKLIEQHKQILAQYQGINIEKLGPFGSAYFTIINLLFRYKGALKRIILRGDWGLCRAARAKKSTSNQVGKE